MKAPRILRQYVSKAANDMECDCCGELIRKGWRYLRQDLQDMEDRQKWIWRSHIGCNDLSAHLPQRCFKEGFTKEDFLEFVKGEAAAKRCWSCPYREKPDICKMKIGPGCIPHIAKYYEVVGEQERLGRIELPAR